MTLDRTEEAVDTLRNVTESDRDLLLRVQRQIRDNEAALRASRELTRRRLPEVERAKRIAASAVKQLRASGLLR